jgi:hypothetical protein
MSYIVTKPLKSIGLAAFLAFIPFGLFYSSIAGGIVMYFILPVIALLFIPDIFLLFLIPLYLLVCFVWAILAVNAYNKRIILQQNGNDHSPISNNTNIIISLLSLLLICCLSYIAYEKNQKETSSKVILKDVEAKKEPMKDTAVKTAKAKKRTTLDPNFFFHPENTALQLTQVSQRPGSTDSRFDAVAERMFIVFSKETIYLFKDGDLEKKWDITDMYFNEEDQVYETKQGAKFICFGTISIYEKGDAVEYEYEKVPITTLRLKSSYFE